jgi:hypothetical protein
LLGQFGKCCWAIKSGLKRVMTPTPTHTFQTVRHIINVFCHGVEKVPVVVIDDYLDDPEAMIDIAATGPEFGSGGPYYPGIRAPFPPSAFPTLLGPLASLLGPVFGYRRSAHVRECSFSLVTTRPEDLKPIQRLPHFDSFEEGRVAALLFLGKGQEMGGTAFYRQRRTGFETIDAARYGAFGTALEADIAQFGMPEAAYADDDSPYYETLAVHEGRFNRMLVYPSASLHSGRILKQFSFDPDPRKGRLTVNAFLGDDA